MKQKPIRVTKEVEYQPLNVPTGMIEGVQCGYHLSVEEQKEWAKNGGTQAELLDFIQYNVNP